MKTESPPVEITVAGEFPGYQYGDRRGVFLNLGLDVEMNGVTHHLSGSFAKKAEMGEVIDTAELERNRRQNEVYPGHMVQNKPHMVIVNTGKNIWVRHLPVRHCCIQLLHIPESLDGNYSAVCAIWQRNFSGITLRKLLRQDYLPPAVNIALKLHHTKPASIFQAHPDRFQL